MLTKITTVAALGMILSMAGPSFDAPMEGLRRSRAIRRSMQLLPSGRQRPHSWQAERRVLGKVHREDGRVHGDRHRPTGGAVQ